MERFVVNSMIQRLGIFGGSFDPPHLGHKALVETALQELVLDELWVIPAGQPVHRKLTQEISANQRLRWVERMFADMVNVRVLDWEVSQPQAVATIETMQKVSEQNQVLPIWLMGMDAWQGLPDWVAYPEHKKYCDIAVFPRRHEAWVSHQDWSMVMDVRELSCAQGGQVYMSKAVLPDISATQIRDKVMAGEDVSSILDAQSADEIQTAYYRSSHGVMNE